MLEIINKAFIYYDKYYEKINYIMSKIDPSKTQRIDKTSDLQRNVIIFYDKDNKELFRQSERLEIYKKYAEQLVKDGHAYYCFCKSERLEEMRAEQTTQKRPPLYDRCCLKNLSNEIKKIRILK